MLPCFFGGSVSRLVRSTRSPRTICARVSDGVMTASTYPRSAATYGLARVSSYSAIFSARSAAGSSALGQLRAVEDVHRALRAHHRDLRGRPGEVQVRAEVLGAHHVVRAAVRLAGDHGDLRDGRLGVRVDELRAAADDAVPLLAGAGQEAGHVHEGQHRDVEGVAGAHEAGGLLARRRCPGCRRSASAGWRPRRPDVPRPGRSRPRCSARRAAGPPGTPRRPGRARSPGGCRRAGSPSPGSACPAPGRRRSAPGPPGRRRRPARRGCSTAGTTAAP